eukprot:TRINITY_DN2818_c0_g1_i1.p1 TRINITY_DN2818_c0_g1~~TRINITY_DN2818_c0_g1_i1.p1  ORF type:complete len:499 (-),score=79.48 TRINITY_DN2818_c0_g1_i1:80-1576(-)
MKRSILALCCLVAFTVLVYADTVRVQLSNTPLNHQKISPTFAGFSFEVSGILAMTGKHPNGPKSSFIKLINNLHQTPHTAGSNIRIGGNSADESWWNPTHKPNPPGIHYSITQDDLLSYEAVISQTNSTIVIDTNMRNATSAEWAVAHIKGVADTIGFKRVARIEIGNEPDLFGGNGIRPHGYNFKTYVSEFEMYVRALYSAIPHLPKPIIQSAVFCCEVKDFDEGYPGYIKQQADIELTTSYHRYPTDHCNGHTTTLELLLQDRAAAGQAGLVEPWVNDAINAGRKFVVGECNSVACGGQLGVSDVFGAALWATDFMFNLAAVRVDSLNFHGGAGSPYTAISYPSASSNIPQVRPLYYAMWLFALTTNDYAELVKTEVTTSNKFIKVWATRTPSLGEKVVVIHKDINTHQSAEVTVVPASRGSGVAYLMHMVAKGGVYAKDGISLGSVTFDGTQSGAPIGRFVRQTIHANSAGNFVFSVAPATIAYLQIPTHGELLN